ncbi:hypothetical protein MJG53_015763 [Ovis ammon polii x Ovis aries]|uniref:Uncharacterized protein n=1 Tax=Ovis ammon polii x Ovis aries TaxID=2918886 RepID=A0ACB9UCB1_9CETA|nr:hypothetical protein MJG53_015763 [Ovis ammon polii x Ovis aries]
MFALRMKDAQKVISTWSIVYNQWQPDSEEQESSNQDSQRVRSGSTAFPPYILVLFCIMVCCRREKSDAEFEKTDLGGPASEQSRPQESLGNDPLNNLGSLCRRHAPVLPTQAVVSGFSLIKTLIEDRQERSHKARGEGYSSPRTRNTNEENFVNVLIPPEKPRTIGEFTRKRLAAAKYAKATNSDNFGVKRHWDSESPLFWTQGPRQETDVDGISGPKATPGAGTPLHQEVIPMRDPDTWTGPPGKGRPFLSLDTPKVSLRTALTTGHCGLRCAASRGSQHRLLSHIPFSGQFLKSNGSGRLTP